METRDGIARKVEMESDPCRAVSVLSLDDDPRTLQHHGSEVLDTSSDFERVYMGDQDRSFCIKLHKGTGYELHRNVALRLQVVRYTNRHQFMAWSRVHSREMPNSQDLRQASA